MIEKINTMSLDTLRAFCSSVVTNVFHKLDWYDRFCVESSFPFFKKELKNAWYDIYFMEITDTDVRLNKFWPVCFDDEEDKRSTLRRICRRIGPYVEQIEVRCTTFQVLDLVGELCDEVTELKVWFLSADDYKTLFIEFSLNKLRVFEYCCNDYEEEHLRSLFSNEAVIDIRTF